MSVSAGAMKCIIPWCLADTPRHLDAHKSQIGAPPARKRGRATPGPGNINGRRSARASHVRGHGCTRRATEGERGQLCAQAPLREANPHSARAVAPRPLSADAGRPAPAHGMRHTLRSRNHGVHLRATPCPTCASTRMCRHNRSCEWPACALHMCWHSNCSPQVQADAR
eukprot:4342515-Alexandrium_andersonii.AAC.2